MLVKSPSLNCIVPQFKGFSINTSEPWFLNYLRVLFCKFVYAFIRAKNCLLVVVLAFVAVLAVRAISSKLSQMQVDTELPLLSWSEGSKILLKVSGYLLGIFLTHREFLCKDWFLALHYINPDSISRDG